MRPGGGKSKGSSYERTIAKILTVSYYPDEDGRFQRIYSHPIPAKGETRGDLVALRYFSVGPDDEKALVKDSSWPFTVECKCYKDVRPFFSGLYASESLLFAWMAQATVVAETEKKTPLVVFRIFRGENLVMLRRIDFAQMKELFGLPKAKYYQVLRYSPMEENWGLILLLLKDFLEWIDFGVYRLAGRHQYIRSLLPKGTRDD